MKLGFAVVAALLSIALPQTVHAQNRTSGQPYIQIPLLWVSGVDPQREQWDNDRERREYCEHWRRQGREIRQHLAYARPYGEARGRLEYRLREAHYEGERCGDR